MQFQYLPMSQVQEGSVVERTKDTAGDFPVGLIKIVEKVSANTITIKGMGNYDKSRFKLIKTKPGAEAQPGDTIIKVSNNSDSPRRIGAIDTCVRLRDGYIHHNPKDSSHNDFASDWLVLCRQELTYLDIKTAISTYSPCPEIELPTNTTQQKESIMAKTTLEQLIELMTAPDLKDATNSKYVGILTKDDSYEGYLYFDKKSEAKEIMARPSNEGKQLHIFEYNKTLAQKPRDVIEVER